MINDGAISLDFDDEVIAGACLTHAGQVRHVPTLESMNALKGVR
jgi:H+-translocating NAD(P) transhydrogenase subunit alpha